MRKATWEQFSPGLDRWTIPAENMKGERVFEVPLPLATMEVLRELQKRRSDVSPFVFASPSKPKQPISENTMAKILHGFHPEATVHGMRSAFRDWAEAFAEARDKVKEYAIAYINNKTESAYLRTIYWNEREELMEVWRLCATCASGTYADILKQFRTERFEEVDEAVRK